MMPTMPPYPGPYGWPPGVPPPGWPAAPGLGVLEMSPMASPALPATGPLLGGGMPHCPPPAHVAPSPDADSRSGGELAASAELAGSPAVPVRCLADSFGGGPVQMARGSLAAVELANFMGEAGGPPPPPTVAPAMLGTSPIGPPPGMGAPPAASQGLLL